MSLISEGKYKEQLIKKLKPVLGWGDGDRENNTSKTADIVNHELRIAIEIKDDTQSQSPRKVGTFQYSSYDLKKLNTQFYNDIRDANKKFRNYLGYKTLLLFRTQLPMAAMVREAVMGIHTFDVLRSNSTRSISPTEFIFISPNLRYIGRKGKHNRKEIGGFIVLNEDGYGYFSNEFAEQYRCITKNELVEIFGNNIKDISKPF